MTPTLPDGSLTDEEIAAIKARALKATAGPWRQAIAGVGEGLLNRVHSPTMLVATCENAIADTFTAFDPRWEPHFRDAEFIAHARQDIPRLLSELTRLQQELSAAKRERDEAREALPRFGASAFRSSPS